MPAWSTRGAVSSSRRIALASFLVASLSAGVVLAGSSRTPKEPERLSVTAIAGSVSVTMAGVATPVQLDSTVSLPARIVTGDDGVLALTQAGTNITVAADSDIEIPAEAADGRLIARLVQHRGHVFYDVAHRDVGTLRVETPFLVAVIKGTQFNVTVQQSSTMISLFQGRLDIRKPDESEVVQLNAGQIAIRANIDKAIRVIGMNEPRVQAPRAGEGAAARAGQAAAARVDAALPSLSAVAVGSLDKARDNASPLSLGVANVDREQVGATTGSNTVVSVSVQPPATTAPTVAIDVAPTSPAAPITLPVVPVVPPTPAPPAPTTTVVLPSPAPAVNKLLTTP